MILYVKLMRKRSHRLAVRTPDSHSDNTGSIPVGSAKKNETHHFGVVYFFLVVLGIEPAGSCAKLLKTSTAQFLIYEPKGAHAFQCVGIYIPVGSAKNRYCAQSAQLRFLSISA